MWISRRKWDYLLFRIEKCEDNIRNQKENTELLVRNTAKKSSNNQESCARKFKELKILKSILMILFSLNKIAYKIVDFSAGWCAIDQII